MTDSPFDHEYPPSSWAADGLAETLRSSEGEPPIPTYDDADVWASIREDPACRPVVEAILEEAERVRDTDVPPYPASLYLDYRRVDGMQSGATIRPTIERARRMSVAALAECFEREGRFDDEILDNAWAICEQTTWLHPNNLSAAEDVEGLPAPVSPEERNVALRPADVAKALAELDYVFGERLHPALREHIRDAVEKRVLAPYEARDDFRWMSPPGNNWNAVCNGGVALAATYLEEDPARIARLVVEAAHNMRHYANEFGPDGCTPEGIHYWNYGLGGYVQLAGQLESLTGGEYSLLSPPVLRDVAQFPLRVQLSPGAHPQFSDAKQDDVDPFIACWLGDRLDLPGLAAVGRAALSTDAIGRFPDTLRHLLYAHRTPADLGVPSPEPSVHLRGHDWWVARADPDSPEGLTVAAKGGHNDESHNHNDAGSFVFHVDRESLLTDFGAPMYDNKYWVNRYEFLSARSLGHSVPFVNGSEQVAGRERAATVLNRSETGDRASFALELADCYPDEANLASLRRTFALDRIDDGRLTVEDDAQFHDGGAFETVLVSYFPMEKQEGKLVVSGERGNAAVVPEISGDIVVEHLEDAINKAGRMGFDEEHVNVWRARIEAAADGEHGAVARYTVEPA